MYRGSCQALAEVSLLLSWKLFKNGPVIMFQIRFGGKKIYSYFIAGSEHGRRSGCGFSVSMGQNTEEPLCSCPLLSPELCAFTVTTHARELLQFHFSTLFFPGRGVKHQGVPMHTLHRPKNFERKDFWKSSAEKTPCEISLIPLRAP